MTGKADYSAKYLQQYDDDSFERVLVRIRRNVVLQSLSRYPHRTVLEVGCGLEPLFAFADDFERMTVVEPSAEFIDRARLRAAGRADVELVHGVLEESAVTLRNRAFDFIVVSSLLHEVADPVALLQAVRGLCRNETVVHFNVPNVRSFHRLLALEMGLIGDLFEQSETEVYFQRHTRFDRQRFTGLLEANGFRLVECATYFIKPFTHAQMDVLLQSDAFPTEIVEGLDRMARYFPDMGCEMFANVRSGA